MAFQPIVDLQTKTIFAHEALVRGMAGEEAATIMAQVDEHNRYRFDQQCRIKAIELGAKLGVDGYLSINFLPNAVYRAEQCLRAALAAAEATGFPAERILFEFTEAEQVRDTHHLRNIVAVYKEHGFLTALDDFGAGYAGLTLLAEIQTDLIKLDMALIRHIQRDRVRQAIVRKVVELAEELGIRVVAEGIEHGEELTALCDLGLTLFQGFHFARPAFQALPEVRWPA